MQPKISSRPCGQQEQRPNADLKPNAFSILISATGIVYAHRSPFDASPARGIRRLTTLQLSAAGKVSTSESIQRAHFTLIAPVIFITRTM